MHLLNLVLAVDPAQAVQNQVVDLVQAPLKAHQAVLLQVQIKIPLAPKVLKALNLVIIQVVIAVIVVVPLQNQIQALPKQVMVLQKDSTVAPIQQQTIIIPQEILQNLLVQLIVKTTTLKHTIPEAVDMGIVLFGHSLVQVGDITDHFILVQLSAQ